MRRVVLVSLTVLCLLSVSSITGLIQLVKADGGTITINADGSITPSTAPIQRNGDTYILTGNINITSDTDGIDIERNNIVLNGEGYTVTGSGNGNGTTLSSRSNVTVNNITIENFHYAIWLSSSYGNTLSGNDLANNTNAGIYLAYSSNNNVLSGNDLANNPSVGIALYSSSGNTLSGNDLANNWDGIWLLSSSGNALSGNNFTNNSDDGIDLVSSSGNTLSGNNIANNTISGISLECSCDNNTFSGNNVTANGNYGIYLYSSSGNTFSGNNVTANGNYGIWLYESSNNSIFHNSFVNNPNQVSRGFSANIWDNGSVGNYWSDYLAKYPNSPETNSSGVWNTPYVIDTNNTDYYPLTVPYATVPEFPSFLILPLFLITTLLAVIIYKKKAMSYRRL